VIAKILTRLGLPARAEEAFGLTGALGMISARSLLVGGGAA